MEVIEGITDGLQHVVLVDQARKFTEMVREMLDESMKDPERDYQRTGQVFWQLHDQRFIRSGWLGLLPNPKSIALQTGEERRSAAEQTWSSTGKTLSMTRAIRSPSRSKVTLYSVMPVCSLVVEVINLNGVRESVVRIGVVCLEWHCEDANGWQIYLYRYKRRPRKKEVSSVKVRC